MDDFMSLMVDYLPISYADNESREYIDMLSKAFEDNYNAANYHLAFLPFHMIFMSFAYFTIWKIKSVRMSSFKLAMVGFKKDEEKKLIKGTSPFALSIINEASIFRFLKLLNCDNEKIGNYIVSVKRRNNCAHSNGKVDFHNQDSLDKEIKKSYEHIREIQGYLTDVIQEIYKSFIRDSSVSSEEREYAVLEDQVQAILIHKNYFSRSDIRICLNLSISDITGDELDADSKNRVEQCATKVITILRRDYSDEE